VDDHESKITILFKKHFSEAFTYMATHVPIICVDHPKHPSNG
jgi:hypothetical protein